VSDSHHAPSQLPSWAYCGKEWCKFSEVCCHPDNCNVEQSSPSEITPPAAPSATAATDQVIDPLPPVVMEAINQYGRYYADHHKLGMSVRDDMRYVASVAIRSTQSLPVEVADIEKDAARYRWLQREVDIRGMALEETVFRALKNGDGNALDVAIDACLRDMKGGEPK